jgi:hypothetical protein
MTGVGWIGPGTFGLGVVRVGAGGVVLDFEEAAGACALGEEAVILAFPGRAPVIQVFGTELEVFAHECDGGDEHRGDDAFDRVIGDDFGDVLEDPIDEFGFFAMEQVSQHECIESQRTPENAKQSPDSIVRGCGG